MYEATQSEDIGELAKALLKVQAELPLAVKDAVNPFVKSRYASLNSIMEACRGPLLANGILLTQSPCPAPEYLGSGYLGLATRLTHAESGQWMSSLTVVPMPKNDPQGMGAAITYARRYAVSAMLGIVTCDDNDCEQKMVERPARKNDDFPTLEGVTYERQTATDGREYVVAKGKTHNCAAALKNAGFLWNPERKVWWRFLQQAA